MKKILLGLLLLTIVGCSSTELEKDIKKLEPLTTFKGYEVYDLVVQKELMCAEAIEFIGSTSEYEYYFNCLKSDQIYFVKEEEIIKVHEFYNSGKITLEELYEIGLVGRMENFLNEYDQEN